MRGTNCSLPLASEPGLGSPPLARDKSKEIGTNSGIFGITPACAGQILIYILFLLHLWDHPRLRGTNSRANSLSSTNGGSPPLARDKLPLHYCDSLLCRITPACAGQIANPPKRACVFKGSPPLARDKLETPYKFPRYRGITPACAGQILYTF